MADRHVFREPILYIRKSLAPLLNPIELPAASIQIHRTSRRAPRYLIEQILDQDMYKDQANLKACSFAHD
jgi:hypothetical protein